MNPLWTLVPIGAFSGVVMAIVFGRLSDRGAIRLATNRMLAHVLEFRLFLDEPKLVLRAQRDLFLANARLLRAIAVPAAILSGLLAVSFAPLDEIYGHGPLPAEKTAVITAATTAADVVLKSPPGVTVETPPVRAIREHEVSWRVRPVRASSGTFQVVSQGRVLHTSILVPLPRALAAGLPWWVWFSLLSAASFRFFS